MRIKTTSKLRVDRPNTFVYDKKPQEVSIIKIGIISQNILTRFKAEKRKGYDALVDEQVVHHKYKVSITIQYLIKLDRG